MTASSFVLKKGLEFCLHNCGRCFLPTSSGLARKLKVGDRVLLIREGLVCETEVICLDKKRATLSLKDHKGKFRVFNWPCKKSNRSLSQKEFDELVDFLGPRE